MYFLFIIFPPEPFYWFVQFVNMVMCIVFFVIQKSFCFLLEFIDFSISPFLNLLISRHRLAWNPLSMRSGSLTTVVPSSHSQRYVVEEGRAYCIKSHKHRSFSRISNASPSSISFFVVITHEPGTSVHGNSSTEYEP